MEMAIPFRQNFNNIAKKIIISNRRRHAHKRANILISFESPCKKQHFFSSMDEVQYLSHTNVYACIYKFPI